MKCMQCSVVLDQKTNVMKYEKCLSEDKSLKVYECNHICFHKHIEYMFIISIPTTLFWLFAHINICIKKYGRTYCTANDVCCLLAKYKKQFSDSLLRLKHSGSY